MDQETRSRALLIFGIVGFLLMSGCLVWLGIELSSGCQMKKHAAPILATILLLLPVLYVASYCALVTPRGTFVEGWDGSIAVFYYRYGGEHTANLFWPLEQLDRKARPMAWKSTLWHVQETVYEAAD